jgi:hypothetical protein
MVLDSQSEPTETWGSCPSSQVGQSAGSLETILPQGPAPVLSGGALENTLGAADDNTSAMASGRRVRFMDGWGMGLTNEVVMGGWVW